MKLSIDQPELLKALESVSGVISKVKITHQCLFDVIVKVSGGKVTFSTYNLQWGVIVSSKNIQDAEDGLVCIPCLLFLKLVKKLKKGDRLTLQSKGTSLEILVGKSKNTMEGLDFEDTVCFPEKDIKLPTYSILSNQLKEGIAKVLPAVPKQSYVGLDTVFIKVANSLVNFLGTNGIELLEYYSEYTGIKSTENDLSMPIPYLVAEDLKRILGKYPEQNLTVSVAAIEYDNSWIAGENISIFFSHRARKLPAAIINADKLGHLILDSSELIGSLERFNSMFKKDLIDLSIEQNQLNLTQIITETLYKEDETRETVTMLKATEWVRGIAEGRPEFNFLVNVKALANGVKQMGREIKLSGCVAEGVQLVLVESDNTRYTLGRKIA